MKDMVVFSREFLFHPIAVSSLLPSSKKLSRGMVEYAGVGKCKNGVVELGFGTGSITDEIIRTLPHLNRFIAFDINPTFVKLMREKYPRLRIINDTAENILRYVKQESVDAVISYLPWSVLNLKAQLRLIREIRAVLKMGGVLVTYVYIHTLLFPSSRRFKRILLKRFAKVEASNIVWINFPPALIVRCVK